MPNKFKTSLLALCIGIGLLLGKLYYQPSVVVPDNNVIDKTATLPIEQINDVSIIPKKTQLSEKNEVSKSSPNSPNTRQLDHPNLHVTDYLGNVITFDKPVESIIALAPHIVENVYSAGAGDLLVAAVAYSNYPEAAKRLPQVGSYNVINYEAIIQLNPDLIIVWESGHNKSSLDRLSELGFQVYTDQPKALNDVTKSIRDIGVLTQRQPQAEKAIKLFLQQLAEIKQQYSDTTNVSVFYQVWDQPLQTINGQHIISNALKVCGGDNIYADEAAFAPVINIESILERDPQAIIASGMADERPDWLDDWKKWPQLTAVQQDNLLFVPPDLIQRHTVRILQGIRQICEQLSAVRAKAQSQ